jgi:hypothetical protein
MFKELCRFNGPTNNQSFRLIFLPESGEYVVQVFRENENYWQDLYRGMSASEASGLVESINNENFES